MLTRFKVITTFNRSKSYLEMNAPYFRDVVTIDKSQGVDAEAIIAILSLQSGAKTQLIDNLQRINVAITRAKSKMVLVGHFDELKKREQLSKLCSILLKKELVIKIKK